MCDRILPAFAVALDQPPDHFGKFLPQTEFPRTCRFLYPPQDADEENLFGQAPHTGIQS